MHLCVVSPFPPELTGVGQYGWNIVQGLAGTGRVPCITVLAQQAEPGSLPLAAPAAAGVRVRHVWPRDDVRAAARVAREAARERPDAVWFNLGFTVFGASRPVNFLGLMAPLLVKRALAARGPARPVVVTLHQILEATPPRTIGAKNGHLTSLGMRTATRLLLQAGVVCVTLRRYQQALQRHYGAANVRYIPHGAYTALEHLAHPPGGPPEEVLFFGSAAPFKGLGTLLEAFGRLRGRRPQATLAIAGSDHPRFPGYLAGLQAQHGAGAQGIAWLGAQPEDCLRDLFARARLVALPYTATTGTSSVLHRAAAYGRPVIASDLPDLRAAAEEEQLHVEYVPPGDAAALARALEQLLADPGRQAHTAQHNLSVMGRMTLARTCLRYLELFGAPAA